MDEKIFTSGDFGSQFSWGLSSSAFQTEGAVHADGKGPSIWDKFSSTPGKIKNNDKAEISSYFYTQYPNDLEFARNMNFNSFRFSISWPRIFPTGKGYVNRMGLDFYNRLIESCLEKKIVPWLTLYHWDLPQALEDKGGWTNRDTVKRFQDFVYTTSRHFGDRVNNWMVLNEPVSFTALGYYMGIHAPGRKGFRNFLPAVHHAALCQSTGAKIIKHNYPNAEVGTCYSFSVIDPVNQNPFNVRAAKKLDAVLNRLFIEPALGMGYPLEDIPYLKRIENYILPGDMEMLPFQFDFIGLQYYFRLVAAHSIFPPFVKEIPASKRNVPISTLNLELYPEGIYTILKRLNEYPGIKKIIITESGACIPDYVRADRSINDKERIDYFKRTLEFVLKAKRENIPVEGFFVWSLTDNFEWSEGYKPRFGLVYIDYPSQIRIIKDSGKWFTEFLKEENRLLSNQKLYNY